MTRLYDAATKGDLELVTLYLAEGDNVDEVSSDGQTALHAITFNNPLSNDNEVNHDIQNRISIAKLLLRAGANVDKADKFKRTALYYASYMHDVDFVKLLLENGANIELADMHLETPLNIAAQFKVGGDYDRSQTLELLLKAGANIESVNDVGFTPSFHIRLSGREELQCLIEKYGVKENSSVALLLQFSSLIKRLDEREKVEDEVNSQNTNKF